MQYTKRRLPRKDRFFAVLILLCNTVSPASWAHGRSQPQEYRCPVIPTREEERNPSPIPPSCEKIPKDRGTPINMLVLGDSIMWGQGLMEEHKFSYLVQDWLCRSLDQNVIIHREAHSGASLEKKEGCPNLNLNGEINVFRPSIWEQLDKAKTYYGNSDVNIVLMDGCYDDITSERLVDRNLTDESIKSRAHDFCHDSMKPILSAVANAFPKAVIVVTGYYPIITAKSDWNILNRFLLSGFSSEYFSWLLPKKQVFENLLHRSKLWAEESNTALNDSVGHVNGDDRNPGAKRISFAKISDYFGDGSGFAAPIETTLVWTLNFNATRRGFFSKGRYVVRYGFKALDANDEMVECRKKICNPRNDCPELKTLVCKRAGLGHPNVKGAAVYAHAIEKELGELLKGRMKQTIELTPIQ